MKKITALLAALLFTFAIAACNDDSSDDSGDATPAPAASEAAE